MSDRPQERPLIGRRSFLTRATLAGAATLAPSLANAGSSDPAHDAPTPLVNPEKPMPETVTADEIKALLKLEPNQTCGFVRETYKSDLNIAPGGLPAPFENGRPLGSALYFMVTPDAHVVLHRIRCDQMYHHYRGDPIDVLLLYPDGTGEVRTLGAPIAPGAGPQLFIPGNTFHMSRSDGPLGYALLGTTAWPGVESPDAEMGDVDALLAAYPGMRADILAFTGRPADGGDGRRV
jgi:predicted cupin superfamily sugar epimerase